MLMIDRDDMNYNQTYQANRVTVGLMISQRDANSINLFTQTTDLGKCRIIWTGQITNDQGEVCCIESINIHWC